MLMYMQIDLLEQNIFTSEIEIIGIIINILVLTILLTVNIYVNTFKTIQPTTARLTSIYPSLH